MGKYDILVHLSPKCKPKKSGLDQRFNVAKNSWEAQTAFGGRRLGFAEPGIRNPGLFLFGGSTEAVDEAGGQEDIILALQLIVRVGKRRVQVVALDAECD